MNIRVRFAPSPTGYLHLGGLRTALFNYLFAASKNGKYVLRIEDTDKDREVSDSIENMQRTFDWLGIHFDEGQNMGGAFGPYIQSQRSHLYQQYARELIKRNAAYHCFCSKERLESLRQGGGAVGGSGGYDGLCRQLSQRQINEKLQMGLPHVIRLKVPIEGVTTVQDVVYGTVNFTNNQIDDQVLLKANGLPTYHLANVVDDHLMEVSHVLRGEEWLSSTGKHILLYKAFDWTQPVFVHLPLLMSSSGGKLSKRKQDVFVHSYRERGFLPEALLNFVALLGWNPKTEKEIFTIEELVNSFSLEGLNKSPAVVDEHKLMWINSQHFAMQCQNSDKMTKFVNQLRQCLLENHDFRLTADGATVTTDYLSRVIHIIQERTCLIPSIPDQAPYFWSEPELWTDRLPQLSNPVAALEQIACAAENCKDFNSQELSSLLKDLSNEQGFPHGKVMALCRYAITGGIPGPSIPAIMEILGKIPVLQRLYRTIEAITD